MAWLDGVEGRLENLTIISDSVRTVRIQVEELKVKTFSVASATLYLSFFVFCEIRSNASGALWFIVRVFSLLGKVSVSLMIFLFIIIMYKFILKISAITTHEKWTIRLMVDTFRKAFYMFIVFHIQI